ncbi:hypothetical protein [Enterococcus sp. LJL90]
MILTKAMNWLTPNRIKNFVIGYWLLLPVLFYSFVLLFAFNSQSSFTTLIAEVPSLTLTFLLTCLMLLLAFLMYTLSKDQNNQQLLKRFVIFALVQQVATANLIGAALVFAYFKSVKHQPIAAGVATTKTQFESYLLMGLIGLLSILVVALTLITNF